MCKKRTFQIMAEKSLMTLGTVDALNADDAVDVWAIQCGYGNWYDMATALRITGRGRVHDIHPFRILI